MAGLLTWNGRDGNQTPQQVENTLPPLVIEDKNRLPGLAGLAHDNDLAGGLRSREAFGEDPGRDPARGRGRKEAHGIVHRNPW